MMRWPIIRHLRYLYRRWMIDQSRATGRIDFERIVREEEELGRIWRGEA